MRKINRWDNYGELYHHGIPNMHWGIRKYQNEDGSLTELGRIHYGYRSTREANRHEEKVNKQNYRIIKEQNRAGAHTENSKYSMKKAQIKQDIIKKGTNKDKYSHEEEMARINAKDKARSEKLKYKDSRAKERAKSEEQKRQYKLEKLRAKTAREEMRRDYDESRRDQDKGYSLDRRQQTHDNREDRKNNTMKRVVAGVALVGAGVAAYTLGKKYLPGLLSGDTAKTSVNNLPPVVTTAGQSAVKNLLDHYTTNVNSSSGNSNPYNAITRNVSGPITNMTNNNHPHTVSFTGSNPNASGYTSLNRGASSSNNISLNRFTTNTRASSSNSNPYNAITRSVSSSNNSSASVSSSNRRTSTQIVNDMIEREHERRRTIY